MLLTYLAATDAGTQRAGLKGLGPLPLEHLLGIDRGHPEAVGVAVEEAIAPPVALDEGRGAEAL